MTDSSTTGLWGLLDTLKGHRWVELSHRLNNESPYWGGMPEGAVKLGTVIFDWGNPILDCQIQSFTFPGQFGTHIDFPGHFVKGKPNSEAFLDQALAFPLVVIDVSDKVAHNVDYAVSLDDVSDWETRHGRIPEGSLVALRTDWHTRWPDNDAMNNFDDEGAEHCPGWTIPVLRHLYEERDIAANGHETFDTDASVEAALAGDLAAERYVLSHGHVQVEALTNLDQVPESGAIAFVSFPRIEGRQAFPPTSSPFAPTSGPNECGTAYADQGLAPLCRRGGVGRAGPTPRLRSGYEGLVAGDAPPHVPRSRIGSAGKDTI
ncbi:cyclase family protein [Olsenella sp. oral taxon 807]|uniref:cyclase family protein n=1 Tax=Olsenella sp. oral taxon 807 TaxID=712411 RepID=UPI000AB65067|nr:cyclase family protein [Olsenella sp. oral taxon 807]